jgi:hypothetical protein
MKNTWISFLIVLSIALQSFIAVANSNESHQVDYQHLKTAHSHDADTHELFSKTSDDEHDINDCHHCGHCQGSHTPWFVSKKESESSPAFIVLNQYLYHSHLTKSFIEEPIRPPIV